MPDYLYMLRMPDESWTLATRQGHLVTVPDYELPAGAPRIAVHPNLSVPTMPLLADECACCAALALEHQEALDAGTPLPLSAAEETPPPVPPSPSPSAVG